MVRAGFSGKGLTLVVGVSGGPDSSALLHCLHRLSGSHQLRLHVAHLNHNFRGEEAHDDARFVSTLAGELGLEATVEERNVLAFQQERRISSFEQAAREFRYRFLAETANRVGAVAVAVGHTADDLAETVLLHLLRGSGTHGLKGMTELSPWPWPGEDRGLKLFRPLLQATKAETTGYCHSLGKDYRQDSGNSLLRFTRNRVRLELLPWLASEYNPRVRESLARLSQIVAAELDYLEGEVDRLWRDLAREPKGDGAGLVEFSNASLAALHPALLTLLLRRAFAHVAGDLRRLTQRHLDAMAELALSKNSGRGLDLPGGLRINRSYDYVRLSQGNFPDCPFPPLDETHTLTIPQGDQAETLTAGPWRITFNQRALGDSGLMNDRGTPGTVAADQPDQGPWTAYLGLDALGDQVQLRGRQPGDRFQPLGLSHVKKLQDFYTDARVPREWRDRVPLLVTDRGIAWVVGYRIAHWARVMGEGVGTRILEVTFTSQL